MPKNRKKLLVISMCCLLSVGSLSAAEGCMNVFATWGDRAKNALILTVTVGVARTAYNAWTTTLLSYKYNGKAPVTRVNGQVDKDTYLAFAKYLAHSGNRETTLTLAADEATRYNELDLENLYIAIQELEKDVKTLSMFARIKNSRPSYHDLVANPASFGIFDQGLEQGFFAKSMGFIGIVAGMDYYYGHAETITLIRKLVLQIAALQEFANVKNGFPRTIQAYAVPVQIIR